MDSIKEFSLGFCPTNTSFRRDHKELEKLKGRIIVPIFSEFGELVGIAGRVPDKTVKGWWNTSFNKSSHLYGFNWARKHIFKNNKGYLIEGYLDRIILAQNCLINSVAVMSSSLGMRRVGLMARYCDEICVCFDTDQNNAGLAGMLKTLSELHQVGFGRKPSDQIDSESVCENVSMIKMPVGVDPDVYVLDNGLEKFLSLETKLSVRQMMAADAAHAELQEKMRKSQKRNKND